jgi:hypothetical protein
VKLVSSPPGRPDCRITAAVLSVATIATLLALARWRPALTARLVAEANVVEWLQVVLTTAAAGVAALQGRRVLAAGRPIAFEVAVVMSMIIVSIGEVDLDRAIFGTKVISTRFFVNARYSLAVRGLAVVVIVGVPLAVGVWLLARWRDLRRTGLEALREPWGQVAASGAALFLVVETFERPLEQIRSLPPHFAEETLELVAAIGIFAGLAVRGGAIMTRMSGRTVLVLAVLALGLSACRGELPVSAAQDTPRAQAPAPREVRVVPAAERALPRTVTARACWPPRTRSRSAPRSPAGSRVIRRRPRANPRPRNLRRQERRPLIP